MKALFGFFLVVVGYAALTVWAAHLTRALRVRQTGLVVALVALPPVLLLVTVPLAPTTRFLVACALLAGLTIAASKIFAPQSDWLPAREARLTLLHLMLISGSALFLIPFAWLIATSLKTDAQMTVFPPVWIPHPAQWRNYPDALRFLPPGTLNGLLSLGNTLVIAIMSVIGTLLSSSLVAYAFARMRWPGRDWLFGLLLATMMLPDAVTMMPRFLIFRDLHWIDTLLPLWVPSFFASAFNVFLLRQFFLGIPQEMEDAAKIDGCGPLTTWWRVMMPLVKPALAAVAVMTFLGSWKDFMGPLIYISSPEKMPLSYVLQLFNSAHGGEPGLLMAATTLVVLPVIILFFFTQRYFVEGVTLSGLGGR